MEEMDGDEVFALMVSAALTVFAGYRLYRPLFSVAVLGASRTTRVPLALTPPACLALLLPLLLSLAAVEVRTDLRYVALFFFGGGAWMALASLGMNLLGLSARDDAIEGRNPAAVVAVCGGLAGSMLCFAGGNIGEGPSIWNTFYAATLATGALFGLWATQNFLGNFTEAVTLDRDPASAARLAGWQVAAGLILGRSVAGDWESVVATTRDFSDAAWPALVLTAAAVVVHKALRPSSRVPVRPVFAAGIVPAAAYVAAASAYAVSLGPW